LFALIVLGLNTYFFVHSMEIRPYALVMLLAAFSMWCFWRWLERHTWYWALVYGVSIVLMLYVHYFLSFLIVIQIIYFLLFAKPNRQLLMQGIGAGGLALALWLPQFVVFIGQLRILRRLAEEAGQVYGLGVGTTSTAIPTNLSNILGLVEYSTNSQLLLYGFVLVIGVGLLWRVRLYWLALLWGLGVPVVALLLNLVAAVYSPRYVAYLTLGLALALGAALAAIPIRWRTLALTVFAALSLWGFSSQLPVRVPYRDIFNAMSAEAQPGDIVYLRHADEDDNLVRWHLNTYLSPLFTIIEDGDLNMAESARRVWFLTSDLFNDDVKADFARLEPTYPVQTVIGQCNWAWCYVAQLMEAPPLDEPQIFGDEIAFWGADVDSVTDDQINTRLWWRVEEAPLLDYSIGLQLLNADGALVAQHDGPIQHYGAETVQTSGMQPGKIYIDFRSLALPPELSEGEYALWLTVYQPWDGERLLLPDGSDHLLLESITVP
jgi:hypothetical protein